MAAAGSRTCLPANLADYTVGYVDLPDPCLTPFDMGSTVRVLQLRRGARELLRWAADMKAQVGGWGCWVVWWWAVAVAGLLVRCWAAVQAWCAWPSVLYMHVM
jgi:hypothetical protein